MSLNTRQKIWLPSLIFSPSGELCKIPLPVRERIKVRVPVSRARGAHAACAIPRAALKCLRENAIPAIFCRTLTASRCALGRLSQSGRGLGRAASLVLQRSPLGETREREQAVELSFSTACQD